MVSIFILPLWRGEETNSTKRIHQDAGWEAHPTRRELNSDLGFGGLSSRKLISHTVKAQRGCSLLLSDVCLGDKIWLVTSWTSCSWGLEMSWTDTTLLQHMNKWHVPYDLARCKMFRQTQKPQRMAESLTMMMTHRRLWRACHLLESKSNF